MSGRVRPARVVAVLFAFVLAASSGMIAQSAANKRLAASPAPRDDEDFARAVKEWTTRAEFSSPLVDHLPKAAGVPSPKDVLGHHIGEPRKLTYYADILRY